MKHLCRATVLMLLLSFGSLVAMAVPVTFTAGTTGRFDAQAPGTPLVVGPATVVFTSLPNEINVSLNPGEFSNITLGKFVGSSSSANMTALNGHTFQLTVTFTLPNDAGGQTATALLTGSISSGASGAQINWQTTVLNFSSPTAGTFTINLEPSTPINSPASPDASRIRGTITYNSPVPEPATMALIGGPLAVGLLAKARRRRRKATMA